MIFKRIENIKQIIVEETESYNNQHLVGIMLDKPDKNFQHLIKHFVNRFHYLYCDKIHYAFIRLFL